MTLSEIPLMALESERRGRSLILRRPGERVVCVICPRLPRWAVVLSQVKVDKLPRRFGLGNDHFNFPKIRSASAT